MFNTAHLHPMIVHFPIALIMAGFLADLLYLYRKDNWLLKTGFFLMILGTLGALAAATTGALFTQEPTEGEVVKIYNIHTHAALTTVIIMVIVLLLRIYFFVKHKEDQFKWTIFFLYLFGTMAVSYTGYIGGTMVYSYFLGI